MVLKQTFSKAHPSNKLLAKMLEIVFKVRALAFPALSNSSSALRAPL